MCAVVSSFRTHVRSGTKSHDLINPSLVGSKWNLGSNWDLITSRWVRQGLSSTSQGRVFRASPLMALDTVALRIRCE